MHETRNEDLSATAKPGGSSGGGAASGGGGGGGGGGGWTRFDRYRDLSIHVLGPKAGWWALVPSQTAVLLGIMVLYNVAGGDSLHAAVADGGSAAPPRWAFYLVFAGAQLLLSQLPDFSSLGVVSLIGAIMSATYCSIAVALSLMATPPPDVDYAPLANSTSRAGAVFDVFNALTTVLFAYGGHNIALEIQATLPRPPTVRRMLRGVHIAFVATALAYFGVAATGFRALGAAAGENIVLSLHNGPAWARTLARAAVVAHVGAAYQVFAHPLFECCENFAGRLVPGGSVGGHKVGYDQGGWLPRLVVRSLLVLGAGLVAVLLPFFGYLMGLIGAVAITPTTFLLPSLLWIFYAKPKRWGVAWVTNWLIVFVTGAIGALGAVGSLYLIVIHAREFKVFAA